MQANIIRSFIMAVLLLTASTDIMAQTTIREIFTLMPDSVLPTLSHNDRLDLLDFYDAKLDNEVPGSMRGAARLTVLSPTILKLKLSERSELQACYLESQNIVCVVHSALAGGWDSEVKFYDLQSWTLMPTSRFVDIPTTTDFLPQPEGFDSIQYHTLLVLAGIPLVRADIKDEGTMMFTYTSANDSDHDYQERVKPHLRPTIEKKLSERKPYGE